MQKRFMCIKFGHLLTDWVAIRKPGLKDIPFVIAAPERGRMIIIAANILAEQQGIFKGTTVADARAASSGLEVLDDEPGKAAKLLRLLGLRCIRYTPIVAIDLPDGLVMDISGCAHLWGGERAYLKEIILKLRAKGFDARGAIADTIGAAWAVARFGKISPIIAGGMQAPAITALPPEALRLEADVLERLRKLGFRSIGSFMSMPNPVLRRRFGGGILLRLRQALGFEDEVIIPLIPPVPHQERLPCLEPIKTATGIEIAIRQLLEQMCTRLQSEGVGLRKAVLKCYRVDGKMVQVSVSTNRGSHSVSHLFKLFGLQISKIEPALGIELFILEAPKVEEIDPVQEQLWANQPGLEDTTLAQLLDKLAGKVGANTITRYLPVEHYWPERSVKQATCLQEQPPTAWRNDRQRPVRLLARPETIEVMALVPDYPPKIFMYRNKRHTVQKADGPERIEREWWLDQGEHRDYYTVEDTDGCRYWLYRSGHYDGEGMQWFIHGFFA